MPRSCAWQVVTKFGEVAYEDLWLFGHREPAASSAVKRIMISPVLSTIAAPQVVTLRSPHHGKCHVVGLHYVFACD